MGIKLKVLGSCIAVFLAGCSGNSDTSSLKKSDEIKYFTGVVNNSSVKGITVSALPIGKHGQFANNESNTAKSRSQLSDDSGHFGFSLSLRDAGPYVLVATPPTPATSEDEPEPLVGTAEMSCQLVAGCLLKTETVSFGEFYALPLKSQWQAAIASVSKGQFININSITEMATIFAYTAYVNDGVNADLGETDKAAKNYYSNYGISKANSQTAALFGLGDVLSTEPANLALLHTLNVSSSSSIEESIRYGALLAAWQQLDLEFNKDLLETETSFQEKVIPEFLANKGQLYQAAALDGQVLTLKKLYQAALSNLEAVKTYHSSLARSLPKEIDLAINRFKSEIALLKDGQLTEAEPVIPKHYTDDYFDAVTKTKAMVNYLSDLQSNFATAEYRESIKASSDLVTAETRRLSPKFDKIFNKLLSIYEYYLSCTHAACDTQSEWHSADGSAGNTYVESEKKLIIVKSGGTNLVVSQGLVFDKKNPEGSTSTNAHDLFLSGVLEFDGLLLKLSDFTSENSGGVKSSVRFSYPVVTPALPLQPEKIIGGKGASVDESRVPDYIELVLPNFELYDTSQVGMSNEFKVSGAFTALMFANTDADDLLKDDDEKLGKRYNLSSVKATLKFNGRDKSREGSDIEIRDNAFFYIDASASESFVASDNFTAYFPDTVYPTFESFFKPREGFEVGEISPSNLVVSRKGTMNLPALDAEGDFNDTDEVEVEYIELDYEVGGLERYVAYPKNAGEDKFWGIICATLPENEDYLEVTNSYTRPRIDEDGNPVLDDEGEPILDSVFTCLFRERYDGDSTPDNVVNKVYAKNKNLFNLREYNGHGAYRINYSLTDGVLDPFPASDKSYTGTLEQPIVLGVDSMRLQFKPNLVSSLGDSYLPESILDISLVWRTHDLISVDVFLAFDTEQIVNNNDGSGLPYLAAGNESESFSIAYKTDAEGNELGEYALAWGGIRFTDGGTKMVKTSDESLKEGLFSEIGSNVNYGGETGELDKKCGFFGRNNTPVAEKKCDAIAYFTFRGLVTGSLREERDGVYVIRYIDGSWQVLGAQ